MNTKLIERTQTGVRLEKTLLKVLKGLAEYCEITLGDLLEGIVVEIPGIDGRIFEGRDQLLDAPICDCYAAHSPASRSWWLSAAASGQ